MGQTFAQLQTELYARGTDYLSNDAAGTTRAKLWLNWAYQDVCERQDWAFLETTLTSQTPPVAFSDLRQVLSVVDSANSSPLEGINRQALIDVYPDLTITGTPQYWYLDGDTLKVMPVSTNLVEVRYVKVPANLSADSDEPLVPDRFRWLLIEGAMVYAYRDDDDFNQSQTVEQAYDNGIQRMTMSLLTRNAQNPEVQEVRYATDSTSIGGRGV